MSKKHTVLIVDDESDIRELLEMTLTRMGLNTRSAPSVASAIEQLSAEPFDLCITDMKLLDGNGMQIIEHIQTDHPEVPVAMIQSQK